MLYIKKDIHGRYIESETAVDTLNGYEDSVGTTWKDYLDGKFLLLSPEQVAFHNEYPELSAENVWNMTQPSIPERTLDDAKEELHRQIDDFTNSKKIFYINDQPVWFSSRADLKLQVDAEIVYGQESITIYGDDGESYTLSVAEANNAIIAVEHYNTQLQDFAQGLHNQVEIIPSLEFADNIIIEDFTQSVPSAPEFFLPGYEPETPEPVVHRVTYKIMDCHANNEVYEIAGGDSFAVLISPNEGFAIKRDDFVVMMGDETLAVQFYDDNWGRPEYASAVYVSIKSVIADVTIATLGYPYDEKGEPEPQVIEEPEVIDEPEQPTADTYYIYYKLDKCTIDNDITEVKAFDGWKTGIYPEKGCVISVSDVIAEMGGKPLDIEFGADILGRKEYASYALIRVDSVVGDIMIACPAHYLPEE